MRKFNNVFDVIFVGIGFVGVIVFALMLAGKVTGF